MSLNLANKITIIRLLLIPVFASLVLNYKEVPGGDHEIFRWLAITVFILASVSDALDGFIARTFNQKTALGSFLDPLADKLLLLTAIILLSLNIPGLTQLPIWFPILVFSRDFFLLLGALIVHLTTGHLKVTPNFLGKVTTVFQMAIVLWILFKWPYPQIIWSIAALLTFASGITYLFTGSKQLNENHLLPEKQ